MNDLNDSNGPHGSAGRQPSAGRPRPKTAWELSALIKPMGGGPRKRTKPKPRHLSRPYYAQVVLWVFRVRFATAYQVSRRFPRHLPSERTAHRRLAHMVEQGLLAVASCRSTAPFFPRVYLATAKGLRWIKRLADEHGLAFTVSPAEEKKERGRALDSVLHELLITEFELTVHRAVEGRADLSLPMTERRYYRKEKRLVFTERGRRQDVIPDAGFLLGLGGGEGATSQNVSGGPASPALLLHFVEMDTATSSLPKMRRKFLSYDLWAKSDGGREYLLSLYRQFGARSPRPNFRLLVVCHDKARVHSGGDRRRLLDLFALALELPQDMRSRLWLTTVEHLRNHQDDAPPLGAPVWVRVKDAQPWLHEFHSYVAALPQGRGQKRYHNQRSFVAERLDGLPRHPLLPRRDP